MKKNLLTAALAIAGLATFASAHAADGTIEFTGNITANTCAINGGNGGENFTVALPTVSAKTLETAGATAGRTPFKIALTNCTDDQPVSVHFEGGPTVSQETGRLTVDAGGANKVELGLLNNSFGEIKAGAAIGQQNSQTVTLAGGKADLDYFVEYHSLGGATAGAANSRVQYSISYQ
ncbi:type 1 fimbrial protein [Achromobacter sp. SD115]|uniref:fimbrial protein n=1 Tax=Achromobacter sp. SD115 TaxID=2782011 RepID=UPI001A970CE8|nr:fimbrial protein [Achromobacter sp. SD115]MBO1014694.1 type 1 fimbrial protein [Achromobacter sp. SD115]